MPHINSVKDKDGNEIPSVTEILAIIAKPELFYWYGKNGWDKCEKIKQDAGEWGTELHDSISQYLKGEEVRVSSRSAPMLHAFSEWKERNHFHPLEVEPEKPYISSLYNFRGTFDAVGELGGELVVADWKTSSKIYHEYGLQLAAYAQLWQEQHLNDKIRTGVIVRIDKKTSKVQIKLFYNLPMYFEVFKSLLPIYDFCKKQGAWK